MAGGFKKFGPTYNSTYALRTGIEGDINGLHPISAALAAKGAPQGSHEEPHLALAGKIAAMTTDGVTLAVKGQGAVGLFREDLEDMVNASLKASFYFRGGEYYVSESRLGATIDKFAVGDFLTTDDEGRLVKFDAATMAADHAVVGSVTYIGEFRAGNMYEWAGTALNGGQYLGFVLKF